MFEEIETNHKSPKFQVGDRVRITNIKIFLAKVAPKIGQEKYLLLIPFRKLILGWIELKIQTDKNGAIAFSYHLFLLMSLVQNFILINNHIETWIRESTEMKLLTVKVL